MYFLTLSHNIKYIIQMLKESLFIPTTTGVAGGREALADRILQFDTVLLDFWRQKIVF